MIDFRRIALCCLVGLASATIHAGETGLRFSFGSNPPQSGATQILPSSNYTESRGYGLEGITAGELIDDRDGDASAISGAHPFLFSFRVPEEGNYRVSVTVGGRRAGVVMTIKAELRRLMVEKVTTQPGEFKTVTFLVNTRTPKIGATGRSVKLQAPREEQEEIVAWDDRITLEFNGPHPSVRAITAAKVDAPTLFLLGDSTVCDQRKEPFAGWGQMLPALFQPVIAVANHAESGEFLRGALSRGRLDKILTLMRPGDYLMLQFGHNDSRQVTEGTGGPFTTYKDELKQVITRTRENGGIPIIVSPMERRNFNKDGTVKPSLADYALASRQVAQETNVPIIDLNAMSIAFYETMGAAKAPLAFAENGSRRDPTHHNNYGAYELAKCVVQGVKNTDLPLRDLISDRFTGFDPRNPDAMDSFSLPASPGSTHLRPLGDTL